MLLRKKALQGSGWALDPRIAAVSWDVHHLASVSKTRLNNEQQPLTMMRCTRANAAAFRFRAWGLDEGLWASVEGYVLVPRKHEVWFRLKQSCNDLLAGQACIQKL